MDKNSIIKEWFYRLPNGYANAPYSKAEMDILHEVLGENKLNGSFFTNEVDQLDQAFHDATPVEDEEVVNIREALVSIGDKRYQLNKSEIEKITGYLEKDMKKKDFNPMGRQIKTASGKSLLPKAKRMIGKFAEEENWQQWLDTVEGIIPDKKLQKLYFTLYDITSATYTAKYIDEVLDELYSADPKSLAKHLFSLKTIPGGAGNTGMNVPTDFYGLADIGTARGGSKGTEMGRGEYLIPLLFDRGELGGANATHDVTINGKGWHVKELKNKNTYIRLGKNTFADSKLASTLGKVLGGKSKTEFALTTVFADGMVRDGVIEALNNEYGGVENDYDALIKIQSELDIEMKRDGIADGDGQGVIFYVASEQKVWFVPTEECVCGGGTQGAHTVGMSHSGRPVGKFAAEANKIG
tara:strand:- start:659 stop:1891 length:1233 start_codon:yes stop_codon:yes gene_type:complete